MKSCIIMAMLYSYLSLQLMAQTSITGIVTDSQKTPVPYARVYLSKTTIGAITNDQGVYLLTIPQNGVYEMSTSCIGFKSNTQIINAEGKNKTIDIKLAADTILIKEVTVRAFDINREKYYKQFVKHFIGTTRNANSCNILNPEELFIYRDYHDKTLKAYSRIPLRIENKALGYNVTFDLNEFIYNPGAGRMRLSGNSYFEPLSGNPEQEQMWERNRIKAYYGSRLHFLKAVFLGSLKQENFEIGDLGINRKTQEWFAVNRIKFEVDTLLVNRNSLILYYNKPILINYTDQISIGKSATPRKYKSTIAISDSLKVYQNGFYENPYSVTWGGEMSLERIAELLPYDFVPKAMVQLGLKPNE